MKNFTEFIVSKFAHRIKNQKGVTILLVEQNIRDSLNIANRAYVLEEGKIIIEGEGRELLNNEHIKEVYLGV